MNNTPTPEERLKESLLKPTIRSFEPYKKAPFWHNADATPLPCLNRNISFENVKTTNQKIATLSSSHKKTAFTLKNSIEKLIGKYGVENILFLTLTFKDNVQCHHEASKRMNSLTTNIIKPKYGDYVGVPERMKSGRIHYHYLVPVKENVRLGLDFEALKNKNYKSANSALRAEWAYWRKIAPKYRFGRTELLPIRSTAEAVGKYVGKYISKNIENRTHGDKGARLMRLSKSIRSGNSRFSFLSEGSYQWRKKVALFASQISDIYPTEKLESVKDLSRVIGKRWAYYNREHILNLPTQI
jgi:hypothetical protein